MDDSSIPPLADRTLSRLRKLADGNGLAPEQIELLEAREDTYTLQGVLRLVPFCEKHPAPPPKSGTIRRRSFAGFAEMQSAAQDHQKAFLAGDKWAAEARSELKRAPGEGWGLDKATITLPSESITLMASEACPACRGQSSLTCTQCQGQGFVICAQCQGRGQEFCYNCAGRGENPAQPGQRCPICNGTRYAPCRFCRSSGKLICPTCQGHRGTPCPQCKGTGRLTQEVTLLCGATTQFRVAGEDLPTGLKRGLGRLGIANLAKGHADIKMLEAPAGEEAEKEKKDGEENPKPEIAYEARLPYADLRMRFSGGRVVMVSVFGKRGLLMGVPPFLDDALEVPRGLLASAARGEPTLEKALEARALLETFALELSGKRQVADLKRLYPVGLSLNAMQEILRNMRFALGRFTRHVRVLAALTGSVIGAGLFAGWFLTPLHAGAAAALPWLGGAVPDASILILVLALGWFLLGKSVQFALRRRFPGLAIGWRRPLGTAGHGMMAALMLTGFGMALCAPTSPVWLMTLLRMFHRGS